MCAQRERACVSEPISLYCSTYNTPGRTNKTRTGKVDLGNECLKRILFRTCHMAMPLLKRGSTYS